MSSIFFDFIFNFILNWFFLFSTIRSLAHLHKIKFNKIRYLFNFHLSHLSTTSIPTILEGPHIM